MNAPSSKPGLAMRLVWLVEVVQEKSSKEKKDGSLRTRMEKMTDVELAMKEVWTCVQLNLETPPYVFPVGGIE